MQHCGLITHNSIHVQCTYIHVHTVHTVYWHMYTPANKHVHVHVPNVQEGVRPHLQYMIYRVKHLKHSRVHD